MASLWSSLLSRRTRSPALTSERLLGGRSDHEEQLQNGLQRFQRAIAVFDFREELTSEDLLLIPFW